MLELKSGGQTIFRGRGGRTAPSNCQNSPEKILLWLQLYFVTNVYTILVRCKEHQLCSDFTYLRYKQVHHFKVISHNSKVQWSGFLNIL